MYFKESGIKIAIYILYSGGCMNQYVLDKQMTPVQAVRRNESRVDQSLLGGLPLRPLRERQEDSVEVNRLDLFIWLRVPLLLLGVIGALGLLAHYRPGFADFSSMIHWPGWWMSIVFLSLAGYVFVILLIDWFYVAALKRRRMNQSKTLSEQTNWRCR
jgi:hypothetical protein